jgi:hypothetical protein
MHYIPPLPIILELERLELAFGPRHSLTLHVKGSSPIFGTVMTLCGVHVSRRRGRGVPATFLLLLPDGVWNSSPTEKWKWVELPPNIHRDPLFFLFLSLLFEGVDLWARGYCCVVVLYSGSIIVSQNAPVRLDLECVTRRKHVSVRVPLCPRKKNTHPPFSYIDLRSCGDYCYHAPKQIGHVPTARHTVAPVILVQGLLGIIPL